MAKKTIDRFSLRFGLLKAYTFFIHWIFYRRIEAEHWKRIPRDRPVLLAPNHQNALMDAMAAHMTSRRDPVFLARADIFKNKFIAGFLRLIKILPVYRMRDGASELNKNEDVFQEAIQVLLRKKCPVAIMPEGNHGDKRRLRPLVKGIFRVAFQAQEQFREEPGVVIVPVGIDYSNYTNFRGKLFLQYGEPIEVSEFYGAYLENRPKAINMLRERLAVEMRKYLIDIRSEDHYEMYMLLRSVYNDEMRKQIGAEKNTLYNRLIADQQMIRKLYDVELEQGGKIQDLDTLCTAYGEGVEALKMRDWLFRKDRYSWVALILADLGMLAMLPVFLYGAISNYFPYWFTAKISKNLKDTQFHSTFKYGIGMFLFPLYYLILFIAIWTFFEPGWIKWPFLASLPIIGLFAHIYFIWFKKLRSMWKYQFLTSLKNDHLKSLKKLRREIIESVDKLIGK